MRTYILKSLMLLFLVSNLVSYAQVKKTALKSIETDYTISKVRTAQFKGPNFIIASSYEGTIVAYSYEGILLWENKLSGFMNHDIWCEDITGNGIDEVLVANADGTIYCLNSKGKLLWNFKQNEAPMYAVCVLNKDDKAYVVCGGYDNNVYYLSSKGEKIKTILSSDYSEQRVPNKYPKAKPKDKVHIANFLRKIKQSNGEEILIIQGVNHTMAKTARGSVYLFKPLADKPFKTIKLVGGRPLGELRIADFNSDGNDDLLFGTSSMIHDSEFLKVDIASENQQVLNISELKNIDRFGYRVVQPELVIESNKEKFLVLFGSRILLVPINMNENETEILVSKYSFNDVWNDKENDKIILASAQSGGSCIHILDLKNSKWKRDYENINPPGKIAAIIKNTEAVKKGLKKYAKPSFERNPLPVYFLSEGFPTDYSKEVSDNIKNNYQSPIFLNRSGSDKEDWDRSTIKNERYRTRRDGRMKYIKTQDEIVEKVASKYGDGLGIAYWGGHGNDPYMFQPSTNQKIISKANGEKTVLIFPELEDHSENFEYVLNDMVYPLAAYAQDKNANIFVRTKHAFWQANIYLPMWSRLLSGEFSNVFVPAMEETTDKSMDLSIAARLGVWSSGAVDSWGARCARDNPSLDRLRQHSHQMLPNHFLRAMVYSISNGAQYLDNFPVDQDYMSLLWELIAKGTLYVPKRSEILSFSPVHLGMTVPDEFYLEESSNTKWTTFYDEDKEENNPRVFSHFNGTWPGAPVTAWDFSKYAAGVKDRRLNFIPPYQNGLVLMTPPQNGVYAAKNVVRKQLSENLHPFYKNILKEYITDGKNYYSSNGKESYAANEYYKEVENTIKKSAELLPLTVSGNVGWVLAQTSPTHLRLTIVDSGYLNPDNRTAVVKFNTVNPIKIMDVLDKKTFDVSNPNSVKIDIPLGMFRFIDIELSEPFFDN